MPTIARPDGRPRRTAEAEEFLGLVCSDAELLRAEFDAIIAAGWPSPPPADPACRTAVEPPAGGTPRWVARGDGRLGRPVLPGTSWQARQRSPPARAVRKKPAERKGGDRHRCESLIKGDASPRPHS
jgi:hypothetical protein